MTRGGHRNWFHLNALHRATEAKVVPPLLLHHELLGELHELHHELLGLAGEHLPVLPFFLQLAQHLVFVFVFVFVSVFVFVFVFVNIKYVLKAQHLIHPLDKELDIVNGCSNGGSFSEVSLTAATAIGLFFFSFLLGVFCIG